MDSLKKKQYIFKTLHILYSYKSEISKTKHVRINILIFKMLYLDSKLINLF